MGTRHLRFPYSMISYGESCQAMTGAPKDLVEIMRFELTTSAVRLQKMQPETAIFTSQEVSLGSVSSKAA